MRRRSRTDHRGSRSLRPDAGGNMCQVFGVRTEHVRNRGNIARADVGRHNVNGHPADRHAFKVPSLRMAVRTAPCLHDGGAATRREPGDAMFEFELGWRGPDED